MIAAVLTKIGSPLEIMELPLPKLEFGQVLVKIYASGICGSQLAEIKGWKGNKKFLPHLMGHEGSGIVMDVGPGVTKVKEGDHVVMHWRKGSGIEANFPKYGDVGGGKITTFATEAVISENRLTKVSANIPHKSNALLGCAITTAFGAVINDAKVEVGSDILILGAGGVGLSIIQACDAVGCGEIMVVDKQKNKHLLSQDNGSTLFSTKINDDDDKFDYIFDTVSDDKLFNEAWQHLSPNGKYILIGQTYPNRPFTINDTNSLFGGDSRQIIISQGGNTNPDVDIPKYIKALTFGRWHPHLLVTHEYSLEDINKAITTLKMGQCGRIIIYPN